MLRARLTHADRWALAVLTLVPVLANVPSALAGRPILDGDNLTQNYPLRVLVGQLISHGKLPLWDPGIWSGVPLLAGWNAGAMFPGTWLFAALPSVPAFEVNIVATGIACGVGLYLFLRRSGCSPLASFLGALTWSETGFLSGQAVHLGLLEGTALAPWLLLAIEGTARAAKARGAAGHWIALFGAVGGLAVLAGDPRAVSSDAIIAGIYVAALCWRELRTSLRLLRDVALGVVLAIAIGAAQWLPGLSYLHSSQRSASTLALFGYYSLGWNNLPLLFMPYLIGGNGNLAMPVYAGPLNMPEVTYAVGILPLIAAFALLPGLVRTLARRLPGRHAGKERGSTLEAGRTRRLGVWYAMLFIGLVLTTGTRSPLGHVLVHIPLYGGQRDQNRNAAIADFALAALLALYVDTLKVTALAAVTQVHDSWERLERWFGAVPVAAVLGLAAAMLVSTLPMERWLGVSPPQPELALYMAGYYAAAVAIALAGLGVAARRPWRSTESRRRAAAIVVVADVLVFVIMASYQAVPLSVLQRENPALSTLEAHLPSSSRIAIVDPDQLALSYPPFLADELGVNDLVLLHAVDSVQGYGSAVPAGYDAATGTHDVENLLPSALAGSTYDYLDLGLIAVVGEQFGTVLARGAPIPLPSGPPLPPGSSAADRQPGGVARAPYPPSGPWRLGRSGVTWQLPAPTEVSTVQLVFDRRYGPVPRSALAFSVALADGRSLDVRKEPAGADVTVSVSSAAVRKGGGALSVTVTAPPGNGGSPVVGAAVVTAAASSAPLALHQPSSGTLSYVLDGPLQGLLSPPHWDYAGRVGPIALYRNTRLRGRAWLEAPSASLPSAPSIGGSVTSLSLARWQDPVTLVDAPRPALLVRSEQYSPGWYATVQPIDAAAALRASFSRAVEPVGLLQGVELPAGRFRITWHYRSTGAEIGLVACGAGWLACAAIAGAGARRRRHRRATPVAR